MNDRIRFSYEGKHYTLDMNAYNLNRIVLPEGQVLVVGQWLESHPPQPSGLHELEHSVTGSPEELARILNGALAEAVN